MFISVPIIWIALIKITGWEPFLLPPPSLVYQVFVEEWRELLFHTRISLVVATAGYVAANIIAITLAVSFIYIPWFESFIFPWVVFIKNIPFVTIASILFIIFGDSPALKGVIVVLICFFTILANLTKGLKSADQVLLDRMKTLNANRWQIFRKVRWPSSLPYYFAAHEVAGTGAIIGVIIAEWMFAQEGLGFYISATILQYRADKVYAATIICSVLATGIYIFVKMIESFVFRWQADKKEL